MFFPRAAIFSGCRRHSQAWNDFVGCFTDDWTDPHTGIRKNVLSLLANANTATVVWGQVEAQERGAFPGQNQLLAKVLTDADAATLGLKTDTDTMNTDLVGLQTPFGNLTKATQQVDDSLALNLPLVHTSLVTTNSSLGHVDNILANGEKISAHYEKVVDAPVSAAKQVLGFFVWLAGRFY